MDLFDFFGKNSGSIEIIGEICYNITSFSLRGIVKMSALQKIGVWIFILVAMFILSDFLIHVGLNSTYRDIVRKDNDSEIVVYQAEATYANGRIRGFIKEPHEEKGKYIKFELYSKRDVLVGKSYVEISKTELQDTQSFELLFRAKDVAYYKLEIVDQKESGDELEVLPREWTRPEVVLTTIMMMLIFWG